MSRFVNNTVIDIKNGRDSWRVIVTFSLPAFATAFGISLLHFVH